MVKNNQREKQSRDRLKLEPGPPSPRCGGQGAGDPWEEGISDQVTETVPKKTKATQRRGQTDEQQSPRKRRSPRGILTFSGSARGLQRPCWHSGSSLAPLMFNPEVYLSGTSIHCGAGPR